MATTNLKNSNLQRQHFVVLSALASLATVATNVDGFQPAIPTRAASHLHQIPALSSGKPSRLYSSVGDGQPPPSDEEGDGLGDFFFPKDESENLKRAREFMSDTSLPISFDIQGEDGGDGNDTNTNNAQNSSEDPNVISDPEPLPEVSDEDVPSSALVGAFGAPGGTPQLFAGEPPSEAALAKNPYMQVVSKLTPSELIAKFTASSSPRVQDAVRSTVLGLIGSLPKMAFDTTTITTGQRLASLMFQLQMTGYMLKNADYRLSLSQSLGVSEGVAYSTNLLLTGAEEDVDEESKDPLTSGKVKGKIKVRYVSSNLFGNAENKDPDKNPASEEEDASSSEGVEIEVDAAAYMSELRTEVSKLKEELVQRKEEKEEALRKDLLLYIRTLPAQELRSLTDTMSQDVLVCMKGLVQAVLGGIGDGQIGPDTVTEQSGEAMAQLCMWQLAVGYNLRELEVREEMKKSLENILEHDVDGGLDGTLE